MQKKKNSTDFNTFLTLLKFYDFTHESYVLTEAVVHLYFIHRINSEAQRRRWSELACCPLVPKFAGSNPAKAVKFFRAKKSSAYLPSEGK
jgi:hypothetical protein